MWSFQHPLLQFNLPVLQNKRIDFDVETLREMTAPEIGELIHFKRLGSDVLRCCWEFPVLRLDAQIYPITKTILRISLNVKKGTPVLFRFFME
jgi:antiviral helicase SLH1